MIRGLIEGKRARKYDARPKSARGKLYDKWILENIPQNNTLICDLCCGAGNVIKLLHKKAKQIVGIDAAKEMIAICNEKFKENNNVQLLTSSVTDTKQPDNHFDYVIIRNGLHHLKDKQSVMQETLRILKPNGKVLIIDRFYNSRFMYYFKEIGRLLFKFDRHVIDHFMLSKQENIKLFKDFTIIKEEYSKEPAKKVTQTYMFILRKEYQVIL